MTEFEILSLKEKYKQLQSEYDILSNRKDELSAIEQAIKLAMNSTYGAYINSGFAMSCSMVGKSVTGMGRTVINYMEVNHVDYWLNKWHLDKDLHYKLGIKGEVKQISPDKTITIYGDTDSVIGDTIITINNNNVKIKDFYDSLVNHNKITLENGKEILELIDDYYTDSYDDELKKVKVKRVIKHKNSKKLFKIKLKSGKEVICTEDHNIMVLRNNKWINTIPTNVMNGDKFLVKNI